MLGGKRDWITVAALSAMALGAMALTGCGDGGSAVQTRDRTDEAAGAVAAVTGGAAQAAETGRADANTPKPVLTANRRETMDDKVIRLFQRNGADFGAETADDYLAQVQAFTQRPPAGTDRVERPNGDVLLYQASTNTFAVVSRQGVAKTMFKPREGAAYWAEQKAAAPAFGRRRTSSPAE
ncbi:S-type pyocin family protein [Brevundimonas sp. Root1279]|nr:S-type pyocin family protein [Brevundimonas sp. Root1279]